MVRYKKLPINNKRDSSSLVCSEEEDEIPKLQKLSQESASRPTKRPFSVFDLMLAMQREKLNKKHGKTIIFASHDLKAVKNMTNKVIYLNTNIKYFGKTNVFFAEGINVYEKFNLDGI